MKLIIDIPDYEYRQIKEVYEKNDIVENTYGYIYHGTPLDDVKAENKGEWIPVSERLPEEGTHILVSVKGEPDFVATDDYYSYGFDDWKDDVTAWQPLPEPYTAESEEE